MAQAKSSRLRQILAKNIRLLRNNLGVTQEELADRAKLHRTYIGMIERAERNLSIDNIEKIARALEVDPHRLLVDRR
ncbi:MAG TPA: helix-turn-helix transcriptional regulator [Burkholderiales bacterium]|jgi:transcriptional regulator with XRE-family HTH domain|nr:helix-turn-helix transcriptional regulator [Burkholderiales bacterium]